MHCILVAGCHQKIKLMELAGCGVAAAGLLCFVLSCVCLCAACVFFSLRKAQKLCFCKLNKNRRKKIPLTALPLLLLLCFCSLSFLVCFPSLFRCFFLLSTACGSVPFSFSRFSLYALFQKIVVRKFAFFYGCCLFIFFLHSPAASSVGGGGRGAWLTVLPAGFFQRGKGFVRVLTGWRQILTAGMPP